MMRTWGVVLVVLMATLAVAADDAQESVEQMIARAEATPETQRAPIYIEIARRQLVSADKAYTAGKYEDARTAVAEIVTYSDKASAASGKSARQIKSTEIALRKIALRLRDIRRGLEFDEQAPVEAAANHLEKLRTDLLARMFAKGTK